MSNFRPINRETGFLLPPLVDEWLPQRHLARFVLEVIDGLDLSELVNACRGSGSASYHPAVLLGLMVYGYATKTFSSRAIERATYDSVAFRFIAGNEHPDHDTIAIFRKRFLPQIQALFVDVLRLARTMGMLKLGTVALDGTKVHAHASRHSALSYGHAKKIEKQLKKEVQQLLRLAEQADGVNTPDGMSIPEELEVPDAKLEKLTDVVIQLTTTNICGSDLHMYEGRTDVEKGKVLGHENLGEVVEVGKAVDAIKKGDKVVLPFNIGCGFCANCERGLSGYCLTCADPSVMPGMAGAAYGFAGMGPYSGGQAELLRVPYADFNCLKLPDDADEKEKDYVMLSDIFPTGWHATRLAALKSGESIVIFGAGPVGLMATLSARIQRASQIFVVDGQADRLVLAKKLGATTIDDKDDDVGDQIRELTGGLGADCGAECVGYQCHNTAGKEVPNLTMNALVDAVKATGQIGVIEVFVPQDPGAEDKLAKKGQIAFDFGKFWFKGQKMGTGQCNVKAYNRQLCELIQHDIAKPSMIISHELSLDEAPDAYKHFDHRDKGWTKVVLHPTAM